MFRRAGQSEVAGAPVNPPGKGGTTPVPAYRTIRGRWRASGAGSGGGSRSFRRTGQSEVVGVNRRRAHEPEDLEVPAYRTIRGRWHRADCRGSGARSPVPAYRTIRGRWRSPSPRTRRRTMAFRRTGQSEVTGAAIFVEGTEVSSIPFRRTGQSEVAGACCLWSKLREKSYAFRRTGQSEVAGAWRTSSSIASTPSSSGVPDNQGPLALGGPLEIGLTRVEVPAYRTIRDRWREARLDGVPGLTSRSGVPDNQRSLALVCDQGDGPSWPSSGVPDNQKSLARTLRIWASCSWCIIPAYRTIRGRWRFDG